MRRHEARRLSFPGSTLADRDAKPVLARLIGRGLSLGRMLRRRRRSQVAVGLLVLSGAILVAFGSESRCWPWGGECASSAQVRHTGRDRATAHLARASRGRINFIRSATSAFDRYLTGASRKQRRWIASTYWRMRGFDPFFAKSGAIRWAPPTDFARDLYAIYRDGAADRALVERNPSWVLRDEEGNPLYIPSDCDGESCPLYAGDLGNPAFQAHWIQRASEILAKGYAGIFIDDVSMEMQISDGAGRLVVPIDPRTGKRMRDGDWRRYVADFTERIRKALPRAAIAHNQGQWWLDHSDPSVRRQVAAADMIELERGYNDVDLRGGGGPFSFESFMAHIDWLHSLGKSVILEPYGLNRAKQIYEVAAYYLTKSRRDAIASSYAANPGNWSRVWNTDLGAPRGKRYQWKGLWRRNYTDGIALVNPAGQPTRTVKTGRYRSFSGKRVGRVTLPAARGAVLLKGRS